MSGHSKWSKVKHQKESTDLIKGKLFTKLSGSIMIAVKEGGGADADSNFKLRLAIDKAKSLNMPKENIQRAIDKASKAEGNEDYSEIIYEAFGPGGVGIIIKTATDNKQRTVSEIKNILDRGGGVLAASGSVSHLFENVGFIEISKVNQNLNKIFDSAVNAGATDLEEMPSSVFIYTPPSDLHKVKELLLNDGFQVISFDQYYRPFSVFEVSESNAKKIQDLIALLEDREDVQKVFSNLKLKHNV